MTPREFALDGRVAVVTGGGTNIGRACAVVLSELGAEVVLLGRREAPLSETANDLVQRGYRALPLVCDVSDPAQAQLSFDECAQRFGRVDIAVANAGVFQEPSRSEDLSTAEWDRVLSIDLRGVMLTCRCAAKHMIAARSGSIVTVSSIAGVVGVSQSSAYVAAKAGVVGLTRALATEWAGYGVRVNSIAPGYITRPRTPERDRQLWAMVEARAPQRRWGEPREVALAVGFLASPAASFITGAVLPVDGGWLAC